ncbi:tannase and feruloyl esterase [Thelephora ganbajun]|uniref:Tannase and feruloyl esterase n=1 Tax=Thelephora ganbajun TaxID=370292 RepID=A0ACB6ZH16_THEGA|nr:tannase and feruloyl esterase [Thelephora ganbajun]
MWLPDTWYGRVLTGGNGGLGGCVEYQILDHGAALHFATIATNNGHDGFFDPIPFLNPTHIESLTDFSYRAVHVAAILGKKIARTYYGTSPHHSYYNGCSAGGRQGVSVASRYPKVFDGILVGAPGVDWSRLLGASAIWASYVAANTSRAIPLPLWSTLVTPEILKQCDGLDGRIDGLIADSSICSWDPETLLCGSGVNGTSCLTRDQVDGLKKLYRPILGTDGDVIVPAYEPGAEGDLSIPFPVNGILPIPAVIWYNYAIYGQPMRSFDNFSVSDLEYTKTVDPAGISTWTNAIHGLCKFRDKGGKVITFHGTRDPAIPSSHSKQFHKLLSSKMTSSGGSMHQQRGDLDEFYRLFMIPGMGHCGTGPGAWEIGQGSVDGAIKTALNRTDHNVLLSLVEWVEGGRAPEIIIGTDHEGRERKHCLWPSAKSVWDGTNWDCAPA